jgi:hypothetical protein
MTRFYVQDQGVFIPTDDLAQAFAALNFVQKNSLGVGTDTLIPIVNPDNPNWIANIQTQDLWGYVGSGDNAGVYRLTNVGVGTDIIFERFQIGPTGTDLVVTSTGKVGIGLTNAEFKLDVEGNLRVTEEVEFELTLDVTGATTLIDTLSVGSATTLSSTLIVGGATTLSSTLVVGGASSLASTLNVGGATSLSSTLIVGGATTLSNTLGVSSATTLDYTLNVGGATTLSSTLVVGGATSLSNTLNVGGATTLSSTLVVGAATTLNSTLQVGIGGTVITTTGIGSVGIGTYNPQFDIDLANDVKFRKAIIDTNNKVGYDTNFYQTPRSVLTQVGVDDAGQIIGGRFFDAANMIRLNLDFIASEAVGYITSTDYANPAFTLTSGNYTSCKDDIKDILRAITVDITKGGNVQSVGAGRSYYNGNTLLYIDNPTIKAASIAAIGAAATVAKYIINNAIIPTSYQITPSARGADAARLIQTNKNFIAAEAVDRTFNAYPSLVIPNGYQNCVDDIKLILDAISYNLQFTGNDKVYDAAKFYIDNPGLLYSQTTESIYTYQRVIDIANEIITNVTVTKISGTRNTFTQVKNLSITPDPATGSNTSPASCSDTRSAITQFVGIVTNAILSATLPSRTQSTPLPIRQIRDLTLPNDNATNLDSNGCANVTSAIYTCANIVTTIINSGPNAVSINNPDGKVIWAPAGADSRNLIWVSKYGNDDNGGNTEGDAKLTVGAAAAIAQPGDTIIIRPGIYYENNPIGLRTDVGVSGQDLRLVTIVPQNTGKDIFHVRRGCLIENMNFACDTGQTNPGGGALAFPPTTGDIVLGKSFGAVTGYLAPGPATEGPSGRWRSPYVRNCTNFMPLSIGMKINGDHAVSSTIGADLKCMVCDSFTQYNEAGIGVSITNNGYAQLVSIFTINCDKAVYVDSGGQCDLTNSNSSFGNYGLYAVGLGRTEFTAKVNTSAIAEADTIVFKDISDGIQPRRPYDGQALWFKIDLSNYNTGQSGRITSPLQRLKSITVINGGSGYSAGAPPDISIYDFNTNSSTPLGPEGIIAEVSPTISDGGAITAVDLVNSGRNYLSSQNIKVKINGTPTNDLVAVMEPIYYTVGSATSTTSSGISTVTLNEFVPYLVYAEDPIEMRRISRILTSGHSFEYIGTGTDINTSTPLKGAVPIKENEIVALDGAQIPYTSTDQKGNFNIGEGIQVDQTTATIRGRDFSKAIQAQVTPLILALR